MKAGIGRLHKLGGDDLFGQHGKNTSTIPNAAEAMNGLINLNLRSGRRIIRPSTYDIKFRWFQVRDPVKSDAKKSGFMVDARGSKLDDPGISKFGSITSVQVCKGAVPTYRTASAVHMYFQSASLEA